MGYVRVSTNEQTIDQQIVAIERECERRGWELTHRYEDVGISGSVPWKNRPGLAAAINVLEGHDADVLVVSKLDRLSRSVNDFTGICERANKKKWAICLMDMAFDTTTPAGEAMANIMCVFAQMERRLIGQRTKDALAVKKANGVHCGRTSTVALDTVARIVNRRERGYSYSNIADWLNYTGIPTGQGAGTWGASSVRAIYKRASHAHEGD